MNNRNRMYIVASCFALALAVATSAYDQPNVNLGFTSFMDGGPPAGAGWYYTQYAQFYTSDTFRDLDLPVQPRLNAWVGLSQVIYQSEETVFGTARWGINLMLPYAYFDLNNRDLPLRANSGFGDLLVGPFLQWDPIMGERGPIFMHRVEFQTIWPTGDYDRKSAINPSSNVISLNPYWAATWFAAPGATVSWRLHYLWNDENDRPNIPDPEVRDTQAGQAVHGNIAASYEIMPQQLRVGLNGYFFRQIENSKANGTSVPDSKDQVYAMGPGAMWSFSPHAHLFFNYYREFEVENRTEGDRINLRYVQHF